MILSREEAAEYRLRALNRRFLVVAGVLIDGEEYEEVEEIRWG